MTEPMSREEAYAILKCGEPGGFSIRGVLDALRDLAKSRPIDLGGGVMVARLEQVGPKVLADDWEIRREGEKPTWARASKEPLYRIRTDQPAESAP